MRVVHHLVLITVTNGCYPGDSGGPVYRRINGDEAKAAGLFSAFGVTDSGDRTNWCSVDPVQNIGNNSGAQVWRN